MAKLKNKAEGFGIGRSLKGNWTRIREKKLTCSPCEPLSDQTVGS